MSNITVLGGGSWGSALAMLTSANNHKVTIWTNEENVCEDINTNHLNSYYTKECMFEDTVKATLDLKESLHDADAVIMAIPSQVFRLVLTDLKEVLPARIPFLNAGKGLEADTGLRESQVMEQVMGEEFAFNSVILSGPNLAMEFARKIPGATVLASKNLENAKKFQDILSSCIMRAYTSTDVIGVECGGSLKNIMAIACGLSSGLGFGDNTKAAIQTRGLKEITRLGVLLGAKPDTFYGLSGLGDMITTCSSMLSRNFRLGFMLAEGKKLDEALSELGQVAEGVPSCKAAMILSEKYNISMPITDAVYKILFEEKSPREAVLDLMKRGYKEE